MDPNAAYDAMTAAWRAGDYATAWQHADDLTVWMAGGGFAPTVAPTERMARYYISLVHQAYASYAPGQDDRS